MWGFLKKLFSKKAAGFHLFEIELPSATEVLTLKQILRAIKFYREHTTYVRRLMDLNPEHPIYPSEEEDKNDPRIWKAGHWIWFFEKLKYKRKK